MLGQASTYPVRTATRTSRTLYDTQPGLTSHRNKAVAEGAVSFYLQNVVAARVAKQTYGVRCFTSFDPENAEHRLREHMTVERPSGRICIPNRFNVLLAKVSELAQGCVLVVLTRRDREQ